MSRNIDFDKPDKILLNFCSEYKIDCFSMLSYFRKDSNKVLFNFYEGHWNQKGTDLTAEFLEGILKGYLSRP